MSLEFAHGVIQWLSTDAAGTTYTISGLSFQPKALRFFWQGLQSTVNATSSTTSERRGIGFAVSTSARRCVATFDLDAAANMDCGGMASNDSIASLINGSATRQGQLDLNAINSDGFQAIVDVQATASITVCWQAWGGSDIISADVGDIAEPAATGTQNYTSPGFQGDVFMFAGCQSTAALNTAQATDSGICIGFATGIATARQWSCSSNNDDGSATSDTDRYYQNVALSMIAIAGGNPSAEATFSAILSNGFQLNWTSRATTNRRNIFMVIKGGSWQARTDTLTNTGSGATNVITGVGFTPKGFLFLCGISLNTVGTSVVDEVQSWGVASSTSSRHSQTIIILNGTAACEVNLDNKFDQIGAITIQLYDLSDIESDGFTEINDSAISSGEELGTLTFGDSPPQIPYQPWMQRGPIKAQ